MAISGSSFSSIDGGEPQIPPHFETKSTMSVFFWHFWAIFIVFHIGYFWAVFAFLGIWGVLGIMLKDSWLKLVVGRVTEGVLSLNNPNKP